MPRAACLPVAQKQFRCHRLMLARPGAISSISPRKALLLDRASSQLTGARRSCVRWSENTAVDVTEAQGGSITRGVSDRNAGFYLWFRLFPADFRHFTGTRRGPSLSLREPLKTVLFVSRPAASSAIASNTEPAATVTRWATSAWGYLSAASDAIASAGFRR